MPAIPSFTAMPFWVASLVLTSFSCGLDQRAVDIAQGGGGGDPELQNGSTSGQGGGGTGGIDNVPASCEEDGSCLCTDDCEATCSGCSIGSECVAAQSIPAGNPCQICDPARSTTGYSVNDGAECGSLPAECSGQDTCDAQGQC